MSRTLVCSIASMAWLLAAAAPANAAWSPPQTIATSRLWRYERPQLELSASGDAVIAWHREVTPDGRELNEESALTGIEAAARTAGGVWSRPAVLSGPGVVPFPPQLGIDRSGNALAVWGFGPGNSTFSTVAAASHRPGGSWSRNVSLSRPGQFVLQGGEEPYLAVAGNGAATVAFTGERKGVELLYRRIARGHWHGPRTLAGSLSLLSEARVALDARGETIVAWEHLAASGGSRWVQALVLGRDGRPRGSVQTLSSMRAKSTDLQLAANAKGDAVLTWRQEGNRHTPIEASTRVAGGRFSAAVILSRARNIEPAVAMDQQGDACVLFTRILSAHPGPVEDGPAGTVTWTTVEAATRPARGRWSATRQIVPVGSESTSEPQIASNPAGGGVIAIWIRRPVGTYVGRAEASTGDALGQWQQPAVLGQSASFPSVVAGATGTAIAAWVNEPPGEFSEIQTSDYAPG